MTKEFAPYELAVKLKALDFNEPCFGYYLEDGTWVPASYSEEGTAYPSNTDLLPEWSAAPTFSQIFRWFREKNGLVGIVKFGTNDFTCNIYNVDGIGLLTKESLNFNGTYEEAELACLIKLIEIEEARI
jgi:hypothetical protein